MSFFTRLFGDRSGAGVTPNSNGPLEVQGGDPDGLEVVDDGVARRSASIIRPTPWAGWPTGWDVPNWDFGSRYNELVDVAWTCLDLNSSILASMPPYRTRRGEVLEPTSWMSNPDPMIYSSWDEFAKQLFWDFQMGEVFVLPVAHGSDGYPLTFRVIPPWMMNVEMSGGSRRYRLGGPGGPDVTDEVLHIRYKSTTDGAHGVGPLEAAGGRMLTAGVLARYIRTVVETGGVPLYTLETDGELEGDDANDLQMQWYEDRLAKLGVPPVLDGGVQLKTHMSMSPKDMAMLEIAQFTEARIAVALGVPPFFMALPSGDDSMTYKNTDSLFDYHHRMSLKPKASPVTSAMSWWALPRGQRLHLDHDEYTRPPFPERVEAWTKLIEREVVSPEYVAVEENLYGAAPRSVLTGGDQ